MRIPPAVLIGVMTSSVVSASLVHAAAPDGSIDFNRDIRPILSENCYFCHGPDEAERKAGLRLDTFEGATAERDGVRAVVPGSPDASELVARVFSGDPDEVMPPPEAKIALTSGERDLLRRWVDAGAEYAEHWAFTPLERPDLPAGDEAHPIDRLVAAGHRAGGLAFAEEAPRETLIRRVALDLTGVPPTPDEVDAFVGDASPDAWERVVDRLLASPAFGERMAWEWLDAARYADTNGYQGDRERTMWPWRDWVVRAFNENLPFDRFTVWQLAGDLLPDATFDQRLATGFNRNHPINGEGGRIPEENRVDYVMDMTETMGTVWLGLTLNCCRCHDHKFDPLSQSEYYRLSAFFNQTPVDGSGGDPRQAPVLPAPTPDQEAELARLDREIEETDAAIARRDAELETDQAAWEAATREAPASGDAVDPLLLAALETPADARTPEQAERVRGARRAADPARSELAARREALAAERAGLADAVPQVMVMADRGEPRSTFVLANGLYTERGDEVSAGVPAALPAMADHLPANRLGLAEWLVSDEHPLTARVTVNRFWQMLFGIGLVKTAEDFGTQGELPPQRALLDWLAAEFRDGGWDVKGLLRTIVTSRTYRQSSRAGAEAFAADPENRALARGPRFRLPSWMLRDQALAVSGLLVREVGGAPVFPYQPEGIWEEASFGNKSYARDSGDKLHRRSLYTFWRRIAAPPMFFDNADRQVCSVKPFRTNTPLHALQTLNDVTFVEAARMLAESVLAGGADARSSGTSDAALLDAVFRRVLARTAAAEEAAPLLAALAETRAAFAARPADADALLAQGEHPLDRALDPVEHAAWTALCLAVLNLDESLTKE